VITAFELENDRFVNTNFDTYNLLRIDQMPVLAQYSI